MRAGDLLLAVWHFRATLKLTSRSLTHQPSNPGTASTTVFGSSALLPVESEVDQESSCYTSDPIIMIVKGPEAAEHTMASTNEDTDDHPSHVMTISSAIVVYSVALIYQLLDNGKLFCQLLFFQPDHQSLPTP
jgi:hypothetical protein